jgi:hypothetical protein
MDHFQSYVSSISAGNARENTRKTRLHDRLDWLAFTAAGATLTLFFARRAAHQTTQTTQWKPHRVRPARIPLR